MTRDDTLLHAITAGSRAPESLDIATLSRDRRSHRYTHALLATSAPTATEHRSHTS